MCGIVGAMSFEGLPKDMEKVRQEAIIWLITELLYVTHSRGKDATGIAASFADGNFLGLKMGVASPEFITRFGNSDKYYDGFMKVLRNKRTPLKTFIGHCRKSSIGDSDDNNNNHPIRVNNIVGVHNGTLTNHERIFKKLKCERNGEVDSEAIMRLIHFMSSGGTEPFTGEMLKEVCLRLAGTYSCLVFNGDNPSQVAAFRDGRPMEFALIRPLSLVIIASEKDFLKEALIKFNIMAKVGAPGINYPCLLKDDVELKMMPDDFVSIFDLTKVITAKTEIEDLFEGTKIPRLDKKWKDAVGAKNNYYNKNVANRNRSAAVDRQSGADESTSTPVKTEVGVKAQSGAADDDNKEETQETDNKGRLWNKDKTAFDHVAGIDATKKIGGVELDPSSEKNITKIYGGADDDSEEGIELSLSTDDIELIEDDGGGNTSEDNEADSEDNEADSIDATANGLPEVKPDEVDTLAHNSGKIEDADFPGDQIEDSDVQSGNLLDHLQDSANKAKEKANLTTDPKILEMAAEAANNLSIYESDADLLLELNITDETVLRAAPLHALANRIMKHLHRVAWANGYTTRKTEERRSTIVDDKERRVKAENNIRIMKIMMKILAKAFDASHLSNYSSKKSCIDSAVASAFNKGDLITAEQIDTLFSAGDYKEHPELRQLKITVLDKQDR